MLYSVDFNRCLGKNANFESHLSKNPGSSSTRFNTVFKFFLALFVSYYYTSCNVVHQLETNTERQRGKRQRASGEEQKAYRRAGFTFSKSSEENSFSPSRENVCAVN